LIILVNGFAQQAGTPFITNYAPDMYKASAQNWAVVQDKRGVMFFGNNDGLLEYDGLTWHLIKTPSTVRSLAIDSTGRIFVGITGDFGYLHPDSLGTYQFRSLKEKIPSQHREFNDVWRIFVSGNLVFFFTSEKIFILEHEKFKVVYPNGSFYISFMVNHDFYVLEPGKGLMTYKNDSLQLIKDGARFANEKIHVMLPWKQNEILIDTRTQGVWIYSPQENNPFYKPTGFEAVDKFLIQNLGFCGTELPNGSFAIGTLTGGILVFDHQGNIQTIYNAEAGLQDNTIYKLYSDNNQQLWSCMNNGVSLVQTNLPFQYFTKKNGLKGMIMCIDFFNHRLYVGTSQYLCVQKPDGNFETIPGTEGQNWQLYKANGTLLLANINGLFEIKEKQAILIKSQDFLNLCPLNTKPDNLLTGSLSGLSLLEYIQKKWRIKNTIKGFTKSAYKIVQDKEGTIWVYTLPELYKLKLNETMDSAISVIQCTTKQGLPTNYAVPYLLNSGEVVFGTLKGIFLYRSATNAFEQHPDFKMLSNKLEPIQQQKNGNIWFQEAIENGISEKGILKYSNGSYQLFKQPFYKFNDYLIDGFYNFYLASDSTVFIGTIKGLLLYNTTQKTIYDQPYHTLIRKVFAKERLLFGGTTANTNEFENIEGPEISYRQNDLLFHYAATFYEDSEKNLYSYRLVGSDTAWSAWVSEVKKEYTNLSEGKYTFEVKSKNQYQHIGSTASYSFRILPPWQRTWWAYTLYLIVLIVLILFIVKIYTRRLVAQKEHLEHIVKERTAEVVQQKEEITQTLEVVNKQKGEISAQRDEIIQTLEIVNQQKSVIEKSHKHITDSINYAKHIQSAVLPNQEIVNMLLPEHFILFKPRDIVSGDFYFIKQIKQYILVAAVDCTGHGVPGAFMSMLGVALLNEIVRNSEIDNASKVLNELRNQIKSSLQQTGQTGEQQDGMDIAFCSINTETLKMSFAGAHSPCWIFRAINNENTLIELSADHMPVGVYIKEKEFSEQTFQLQKGDVFYIFSDGYNSQFGGDKNNKYKAKRMKDFLQTICYKPMAEQNELLENDFNMWKGNNEQTDDVLVIGVKI